MMGCVVLFVSYLRLVKSIGLKMAFVNSRRELSGPNGLFITFCRLDPDDESYNSVAQLWGRTEETGADELRVVDNQFEHPATVRE